MHAPAARIMRNPRHYSVPLYHKKICLAPSRTPTFSSNTTKFRATLRQLHFISDEHTFHSRLCLPTVSTYFTIEFLREKWVSVRNILPLCRKCHFSYLETFLNNIWYSQLKRLRKHDKGLRILKKRKTFTTYLEKHDFHALITINLITLFYTQSLRTFTPFLISLCQKKMSFILTMSLHFTSSASKLLLYVHYW